VPAAGDEAAEGPVVAASGSTWKVCGSNSVANFDHPPLVQGAGVGELVGGAGFVVSKVPVVDPVANSPRSLQFYNFSADRNQPFRPNRYVGSGKDGIEVRG